MPVFFQDDTRILFIHVPKAGGTSIEMFFDRNGFKTAYLDRGQGRESLNPVRRSSPQHMGAKQLEALFNLNHFTYIFMIVRHPVHRLISEFVMQTGERSDVARLETWLTESFPRVLRDREAFDNHLRPQSDFIVHGAQVFRLENGFAGDFVTSLESGIGRQFRNREVGRDMSARAGAPDFSSIHPALQRMVLCYYATDFENFGYPPQ